MDIRIEPGSLAFRGRCQGGTCIEVAPVDGVVVRATTDPDGVIAVTRPEWAEFLRAAKAGEFDDV